MTGKTADLPAVVTAARHDDFYAPCSLPKLWLADGREASPSSVALGPDNSNQSKNPGAIRFPFARFLLDWFTAYRN